MNAISPFTLPLSAPLETAAGTIDRREGFLVRIGAEPAGLGEATPLVGWTESIDACRDALAAAIEDDSLATPADLPAMATTPAARHGLELALLDRLARVDRVALYRQLGADRRVTTLPVNATVGDADVAGTATACRAVVEAGYRSIKVKVGARAVDADLERLTAVRQAVGPAIELRVDANGAWAAEEAERAIEGLAALEVAIVEQPLAPDALEAHGALRGRGVDIAVDETLREHAVEAVLDADAADVIVLKPMVLGGVGRARTAAERASAAGVDVVVTTTVDGAVARAGAVHLAAAIDVDRACGLATAGRLASDVAGDPAPVVDGAISVPQGAGTGVAVGDLD